MFWSKKQKQPAQNTTVEENFLRMLQRAYETLNEVRDVYIAAVGDDEFGAHIQVSNYLYRRGAVSDPATVTAWADRARRKVERLSFVRFEVSGHDHDSDYRSIDLRFDNKDAAALIEFFLRQESQTFIYGPQANHPAIT